MNKLQQFKEGFEDLGYIFQNNEVLEDIYTFYQYYDSKANKNVAAVVLEGDPGCGKTYLAETFSKYCKGDYIRLYCCEETNKEQLIATLNFTAFLKGDAENVIAEGVLTKTIEQANNGNQVVLIIDELDKSRQTLDNYFLNFLDHGEIITTDNKVLRLTPETRKNVHVIFAKNNERELNSMLIRRSSVIQLPPMPPALAFKILTRNYEDVPHDPKFLFVTCKVYEAIYNKQKESNGTLLERLPAVQELSDAISSDAQLMSVGASFYARIKKLVRTLAKNDESKKIVTDILETQFKYNDKESNYENTDINIHADNLNNFLTSSNSNNLLNQYFERKENGEDVFYQDNDDPLKNIANILENIKNDSSLYFLDSEDKEEIIELGKITHDNFKALNMLFDKIDENHNGRCGFLSYENNSFIGLSRVKDIPNSLFLIANRKYISPRLLMKALRKIINIIYDYSANKDSNYLYFGDGNQYKLTHLNVNILSKIPKYAVNKMKDTNGIFKYEKQPYLKITYDKGNGINFFQYCNTFRSLSVYETMKAMCEFNPELAIPLSYICAKKLTENDRNLVRKYSEFEEENKKWKNKEKEGWKVIIDEFIPMEKTFKIFTKKRIWDDQSDYIKEKDIYVFDWNVEEDFEKKELHVYPKYQIKDDYLIFTDKTEFENHELLKNINQFNKEIILLARDIFGNFVPLAEHLTNLGCFSQELLSTNIPWDYHQLIDHNITSTSPFTEYYDQLSHHQLIKNREIQ